MSSSPDQLVLPRPGATSGSQQKAIQGPTEASFVEAFGQLLPSAQFLITDIGKAAYFEFPPLSEDSCSRPQSRVLLIHGVQTPALGLLPLIRNLQKISPHAHFVVVDLWGHGLSDTPLAPHDAALFHHLLDTLLDHLAWSSVHLIGYSFGGSLTAGYVTLRSSRLQSFTLVAPAGLIPLSMFSAEEQDIFLGNDEVAAKNWILGWLEGGDLVVPTDWKERVAKGEVVAEAVREWEVREHLLLASSGMEASWTTMPSFSRRLVQASRRLQSWESSTLFAARRVSTNKGLEMLPLFPRLGMAL